MKKLVITDWNTLSMTDDLSTAALQELADVTAYPLTAPEEAAARIGDAELLLCNKTPITAAVLDACPNLKYIGVMATGYNNIDLKAAAQHGITVCNAGSYSTMAVAQHTFALMLHHFSRIAAYDRAVRAGAWEKSLQFSWFPYPTAELAGKTLCVVGYGSIGKAVAKIGQAFGMQVKITTRTTPTDCPFPVISMEEAFQTADVLTIHTPLTPETQHLVNAERLASMKPTAFLINTARGGIVDETALAEALQSDVIAGAAVDVLDTEPMSDQTPLRQLPNCTITPHVAWAAVETRKRLLQIVTENVAAYLNGTPQNVVS